jgi:hypothetical protein
MCDDTWKWQSTNPYGYKVKEIESEEDKTEKEIDVEVIETITTK